MFIADLHIHSKYSRATSRECVPEVLELWARRKGLGLIGTGDFTHPAWREELKEKLTPSEEGLYILKKDFRREDDTAGPEFIPRFIVSGEISSIYKKNGRVRKVHNLILLPGLEHAEALSRRLETVGNLHSDGRPILGLDSRSLLEITLDVCPEAMFIPAHIWTPHFSLFGAYSGFDDITECFEDLTGHIHALETGLSSDPPMNRRISALDGFTLVSNSDAHSPGNLAREANLFNTELSYPHIAQALEDRDSDRFYGTLEFFPEEGKYHYDGHRSCKVRLKPADSKAASGICPVCGGRLTAGVLHRVEALADRDEGCLPPSAKHFESLVPLGEVIASSIGLSPASLKVKEKYDELVHSLGPELFILREATLGDIELKAGPCIAEGIRRLRLGKVEIEPGYDGEYGKVKIMDKNEIDRFSGQLCFLNEKSGTKPKSGRSRKSAESKAAPPQAAADTPAGGQDAVACPAVLPDTTDGLNREQREAVSASDPVVAVVAGPGTGKTMTLVSRILHLVEKCGVPPSKVTAVTFTNKAAGEMRARLEKRFGDKRIVKAMTIGTFHSICLQILSGWNDGSITIIDEYNALSIVEDILKSLKIKKSPRDVIRGISLKKNGTPPGGETPEVPPEVYELYCEQLERYGVSDYDDILLKVLGRFEGSAPGDMGVESLMGSFSQLLVDEFQDVSEVQYRLIKAWGGKSKGIFVIGDPDQSVYSFRGADSLCFERLSEDFPGIRKILLTRNYRSTPEILDCARSVISRKAAGGHERSLEASRKNGPRVRLLEAENEFSEALFIAREINRMVGGMDMLDAHNRPADGGKKYVPGHTKGFSDIAVLYRTNRQAELLEQCLIKEGIPYSVAGREEFLADRQVRRAIAFFRFLLNPADLVSLRLCLKEADLRPAGLVQKVVEDYHGSDKSISSLYGILERLFSSSASGGPQILMGQLQKYEPAVLGEKPQKLISSWIEDNALSGHKCMDLLFNTSVFHDGMPSFLQNLALGRESDIVRRGGRSYSPDAVSLMTLHAAKGLEFPVVLLCGVTDGLIPFRNRSGGCNSDEERRLFYVGVTRAQDELVLLTSQASSPFLEGLPEGSLSKGNAFERRQEPEFHQFSLFDMS